MNRSNGSFYCEFEKKTAATHAVGPFDANDFARWSIMQHTGNELASSES
ncbi:MAG: hypothetical protein ACR2NK_05720 [Mariniblastus sp.]